MVSRSDAVSARERAFSRPFFSILGNLVCFLCFFGSSATVLEGAGQAGGADWLIFAAWVVSGIATLVYWSMAMLPLDLWIRLVRQSWGNVLAGSVLGCGCVCRRSACPRSMEVTREGDLQFVRGMLSLLFADVVYDPE